MASKSQHCTFRIIYTPILLLVIINWTTSPSTMVGAAERRTPRKTREYQQPSHPPDQPRHKFKIETEDQCWMYLCKYGYLNCNCTQYLKPAMTENGRDGPHERSRRELSVVMPIELNQEHHSNLREQVTAATVLTTPSSETCSSDHFRQGYQKYQQLYRLPVTGECDSRTMQLMSQTRCGQPDIFDMDEVMAKEMANHQSVQRSYRSTRDIMLNLKDTTFDKISERRYQILKDYMKEQENQDHSTYNGGNSIRNKRSVLDIHASEFAGFMTKERISWRLMSSHVSPDLPVSVQNAVLMHAFRYWSEVSPLCFEEKKTTPTVDIEIGFLEGAHLNCFKQFDGFGGEIAHKFIRDVHFDKTEPYTGDVNNENAISLLLVAVHEIGHVLGFNHSASTGSVMNAIYHRTIKGKFELSDQDRAEVKRAYGSCDGKFDLVFDYVRTSPDDGKRIFNTYFFRSDRYWMYENMNKRPRFGDPMTISSAWKGLPNPANLDAFVHYFIQDSSYPNSIHDEYFFFKGDKYYKYSVATNNVSERGQIGSKFKPGPHGSVPSNLDTAFYNFLAKEILFFKGERVWKYAYSFTESHSCCEQPAKRIVDMFPPKTPSDLRAPNGETYTSNLDAIYFSWAQPFPLYLIKGSSAWKVEGYSVFSQYQESNLKVKYVGPWNDLWHYICDVDCSR